MDFYTVQKISNHKEKTPEGFLLCKGVPVARTGTQIYLQGEIPVEAGDDGQIIIERDEAEVFNEKTIASFNGKPVVIGHPYDGVNSENWNDLAVGVAMNARRGTTPLDCDLLIMDLLITSSRGIDTIESGRDEISVGYMADYETISKGRGRQKNIIGNHFALVDEGRCGTRCSIGDQARHKETVMANSIKEKVRGWLQRARTGDEAACNKVADEISKEMEKKSEDEKPDPEEKTSDEEADPKEKPSEEKTSDEEADPKEKPSEDEESLPAYFSSYVKDAEARFGKVEKTLDEISACLKKANDEKPDPEEKTSDEEADPKEKPSEDEMPDDEKEKAANSKDSIPLELEFQNTISLAEVIVPGIRLPTFDSAAAPVKTMDSICRTRKRTIDLAWDQPKTRLILEDMFGGNRPDVEKMKCRDLKLSFNAIGAACKQINRKENQMAKTADSAPKPFGGNSPAEFNKAMAKFYETN